MDNFTEWVNSIEIFGYSNLSDRLLKGCIMPVLATLGSADYKEDGSIAVPVTFGENVIAPSKTVFHVSRVSGDDTDLSGLTYILLGEGTAYELFFTIPLDRSGQFMISAVGDVLKSNGVWDNISVADKTVMFDTTVPEVKDRRVVRTGERIDVILQYQTDCTLNNPVTEFGSDDATFADFLDYGGENLDPPNFYRKVNNDYPTIPIPDFPVTGNTNWSPDNLTTTSAQIYLIRWSSVAGTVDLDVTIKPRFVRGPVS